VLPRLSIWPRNFDEISQDSGKYCFGIADTLKALELGAVETLIVWENQDDLKSTGLEMEQAQEPQPLLEWFAEKYKEFGANLEFVTNRSQEGAQFVKGFGGIGGLLRYKVDFTNLLTADDDEDEFLSDDDDI